MEITGTVVYEEIEGGFWGIAGDDGQKYKPVDPLPQGMQVKGKRIKAEVERANVMSFTMWGRNVHVHKIEGC